MVLGIAYGCPCRFTEFVSKVLVSPGVKVAPGGTRMLSRLRVRSPPVRSSMREGSIPFSCVRYCATLRSRWAAASGASSAECLPTIISLAEDSRLRVRATSSRQPLASLSTRTGRFLSRSKEMLQRLRHRGGGGGGGAVMVTDVFAVACLPRSSTTLQVTLMAPGDAPMVLRVAVAVLLPIWPAEAE